MKIKLLPESVYSKIAAGEVIDKPASIVRELIDNSIDAQATEIVISLKKGGIEEICVRDNGCGMEGAVRPCGRTEAPFFSLPGGCRPGTSAH